MSIDMKTRMARIKMQCNFDIITEFNDNINLEFAFSTAVNNDCNMREREDGSVFHQFLVG